MEISFLNKVRSIRLENVRLLLYVCANRNRWYFCTATRTTIRMLLIFPVVVVGRPLARLILSLRNFTVSHAPVPVPPLSLRFDSRFFFHLSNLQYDQFSYHLRFDEFSFSFAFLLISFILISG